MHIQAAEWEPCYAGRAERMRASEIRELLKLLDRPGIISLAGGIPDPALFPAKAAQAAYAAVLGDAAQAGPGPAVLGQRGLSAVAAMDRSAHGRARGALPRGQYRHHLGLAAGAGVPGAAAAVGGRHGAGDGADLSRRAAGLLG